VPEQQQQQHHQQQQVPISQPVLVLRCDQLAMSSNFCIPSFRIPIRRQNARACLARTPSRQIVLDNDVCSVTATDHHLTKKSTISLSQAMFVHFAGCLQVLKPVSHVMAPEHRAVSLDAGKLKPKQKLNMFI
jgi:hypothetical protein